MKITKKIFKILVVEKDMLSIKVLKTIRSENENCDIIQATCGENVINKLLNGKFDLAIIDMDFFSISQEEIKKVLLTCKKISKTPIILSYDKIMGESTYNALIDLGVLDFIQKPFYPKQLKNKIEYYLKNFVENQVIADAYNNEIYKIKKNEKLNSGEIMSERICKNFPSEIILLNSDAEILFTNNNAKSQFFKFAIGDSFLDMIPSKYTKMIKELIDKALYKGEVGSLKFIYEIENEVIWYFLKIFPVKEENDNVVMLVIDDLNNKRIYDEEFVNLSFRDKLTGLYNRHFLDEAITHLDNEKARPVSVVIGDLNGLKIINDAFGHFKGDEVLAKVANVFSECANAKDIVARWGGDEFLILLPYADVNEALRVKRKIQNKLKTEFKDYIIKVQCAIGVDAKKSEKESIFSVIERAETSMYKNKINEEITSRKITVKSLVNTLFERNIETEGHTKRITSRALEMANALELSDEGQINISLLATLHDIGKVALPESLLLKGEPFDEDDWEAIRTHPEIGYRICKTVTDFAGISKLILTHHERWDGNGYPNGLKGNQIPYLARVFSVIDAYDVMLNPRYYKVALTHDEALLELKKCANTQFDGTVVDLFCEMYK